MRPARHTLTVAALLALTACASPTPSTSPPEPAGSSTTATTSDERQVTTSTPTATTTGSSEATPDDVADAVAREFWAANTLTDTSPADAAGRAALWLTPTYAAAVTEPLPGGPGAQWLELVDHQGQTTALVDDADDLVPDLPPDSDTSATRVRIITLTPHGEDGWVGDPQYLVATMRLTRPTITDPWLVDLITIDEPQGDVSGLQDFD